MPLSRCMAQMPWWVFGRGCCYGRGCGHGSGRGAAVLEASAATVALRGVDAAVTLHGADALVGVWSWLFFMVVVVAVVVVVVAVQLLFHAVVFLCLPILIVPCERLLTDCRA